MDSIEARELEIEELSLSEQSDCHETPKCSTLERGNGSAEGVFYSGFATSLFDELGEVVIIGKDLNDLIRRWYSMTGAKLDVGKIKQVAFFKKDNVKPSAIE